MPSPFFLPVPKKCREFGRTAANFGAVLFKYLMQDEGQVGQRDGLADVREDRQAKDTELIQRATEIKVRAERRCGELLALVERSAGGRPQENSSQRETSYQHALISNNIPAAAANRYQQLAAMPDEHFETLGSLSNAAAVLSTQLDAYPAPKPIC